LQNYEKQGALDGQQILKYQQNQQSPLALKKGITRIPFK
jgi:hypothetical protein